MAKTVEMNRNLLEVSVGEAKETARQLIKGMSPQQCPSIVTIGPTGCGKTEVWRQLAEEEGLSLIMRHLSQVHPLDLAGIGLDSAKREMYFAVPPIFTEVMSQKGPRLLVLDEIDRMAPIAQSAALQILSEKKLNGHQMTDTYIVAAANAWHAQYTYEFDAAMSSRLCMLHVTPRAEEWLGWAAHNHIDTRILIAIGSSPDILNQHESMTEGAMKVADPRAWHNLSNALTAGFDVNKAAMFVGQNAAATFMRYADFARDWNKEIAKVAKGELLTLPANTKAADRAAIEFSIYLAAAASVRDVKTAKKYLQNACEQIGDEKTYIAGGVLTYSIPAPELCADKDIQAIHLKIRGTTFGEEK